MWGGGDLHILLRGQLYFALSSEAGQYRGKCYSLLIQLSAVCANGLTVLRFILKNGLSFILYTIYT